MRRERTPGWPLAALCLVLVSGFWSFADQKKDLNSAAIQVKPDLRIAGIQAERIGVDPDGTHRLRVRVVVQNSAAGPACASSFQVSLEKRAPGGAYGPLGQQLVARLCADPAQRRAASLTLAFDDSVPTGQQRAWRATVDSSGAVAESREENNQAESETYVAKSFCPGVDLAITRLEFTREGDGEVFVRCFGRNRCLGSCATTVAFSIEVVDPAGSGPGIVQPVGVRIGPLQEFETMGVGIYSRSDRAVTYRVRIDPAGASCADVYDANNACSATLRPEENRKTVTCR